MISIHGCNLVWDIQNTFELPEVIIIIIIILTTIIETTQTHKKFNMLTSKDTLTMISQLDFHTWCVREAVTGPMSGIVEEWSHCC